jgi:membrane-associated protease RseP (regulator of RpoE activity)
MPFRKWYGLKNVRVFGAPIYIHWSVIAVVLVVAAISIESPAYAAITIASYLGIIAIHEFGHAFVAARRGFDVLSIRIGFIHGHCEHEAPSSEWDEVAIAWGGVIAQLLVAVPILALAGFLDRIDLGHFGPIVVMLGYLNCLIAMVNLAPAAGLDGAIAWRVIPLLRAKRNARSAAERAMQRWRRR